MRSTVLINARGMGLGSVISNLQRARSANFPFSGWFLPRTNLEVGRYVKLEKWILMSVKPISEKVTDGT